MLERSLKRIEDSTLGRDSEEDFGGLFSDIDLASPKLGKTADDKNMLVSNVLLALDDIKFGVEASQEIDILGDAYEYMISQFAAGAGKKAGEFYTPQEVSRILVEYICGAIHATSSSFLDNSTKISLSRVKSTLLMIEKS